MQTLVNSELLVHKASNVDKKWVCKVSLGVEGVNFQNLDSFENEPLYFRSIYGEPGGKFTWHDIACNHKKPVICEDSDELMDIVRRRNPRIRL